MEILLEPYQYSFFVNGLAVATLAGALCGLIGVFVVLRGMSYLGHGLSHSIFGGFAASSVVSVNYYLGAGVWGLLSAVAINRVARSRRIGADAAIGVVTTASFAAGIALLKVHGSRGPSFEAALFGSIMGVSATDLVVVAAVTVFAVLAITLQYRALLFTTFDPEVAGVFGVKVGRTELLLTLIISLAVLATLTVVGVTLVAATLVTPAVIARMVTDSFPRMLILSSGTGAACGFLGMNASYFLDVPSGTTIILVGALVFCLVLLLTPGQARASAARGRRQATRIPAARSEALPAPQR